uniref:Uncharacterized protein n=1 Tax=Brassica campestris TaxID=3711 RepID=M4D0T7_BRACM
MAVEKLNTTVDGVEILKPRTDNREYRKIVLKNSLQVLLISDPDTDKDGDDNDRDDMHGTNSVLTKGGVCFNDHEESSPARTTASGLATKKLRVLATPKVVKKARNAYLESVFSI